MWQFMQIYVQQLRMQMGALTIESAMHMSLAANYIGPTRAQKRYRSSIEEGKFIGKNCLPF